MTAVKLTGCALLSLAGALLGWNRREQLRRRGALLRALCAALGVMAEELTALSAPLPAVFQKLSDRPFFELLAAGFGEEPTAQLWRRAARSLELPAGDRETLAGLSEIVGRYAAQRQAAEIELVRSRLAERAAETEREEQTRARTLPGLGASLGAMLAVLLF